MFNCITEIRNKFSILKLDKDKELFQKIRMTTTIHSVKYLMIQQNSKS